MPKHVPINVFPALQPFNINPPPSLLSSPSKIEKLRHIDVTQNKAFLIRVCKFLHNKRILKLQGWWQYVMGQGFASVRLEILQKASNHKLQAFNLIYMSHGTRISIERSDILNI